MQKKNSGTLCNTKIKKDSETAQRLKAFMTNISLSLSPKPTKGGESTNFTAPVSLTCALWQLRAYTSCTQKPERLTS